MGRYINNAAGFDDAPSKSDMREILLETIKILSDAVGESEERVFAGAFCDKITGSGWGMDNPPKEHEASS